MVKPHIPIYSHISPHIPIIFQIVHFNRYFIASQINHSPPLFHGKPADPMSLESGIIIHV